MIREISETTMRNKYHLKNNLVIKYFRDRIPSKGFNQEDAPKYREILRNLCWGNANCQEFNNSIRLLTDIIK